MAEAAILPFMALLLAERGFTPAGIGLVLSLMSLAAFVASPLWGYTADRWRGAERTLQAGATVDRADLEAAAGVLLAYHLGGRQTDDVMLGEIQAAWIEYEALEEQRKVLDIAIRICCSPWASTASMP